MCHEIVAAVKKQAYQQALFTYIFNYDFKNQDNLSGDCI